MPLLTLPVSDDRTVDTLPWRGVLVGSLVALALWPPIALASGGLSGLLAAMLLTQGATLGALADLMLRVVPTARRRAEALHEGAERLRAIIDTSIDAIIVTDRDGRITAFNRAAETLFGYAAAEVRGLRARSFLVAQEVRDRMPESWTTVLNEGESASFEITMLDNAGRTFPAEVALGRGRTDRALYVACLRDVSQRHAAEAALREARDRALAGERAKSDFLAVMSHEMRTPLNGLLGAMELLREAPDDAARAALLARMQGAGAHLLDIVNDTLALASYESGTLRPEPVAFALPDLLEDVVAAARPMAEANGNALCWRWVGAPRRQVVGDLRRLRQILLNLATNAAKFTRDGTVEIEVELLDDARAAEFRVIDTGIGIAEADLERIFEDFERVDSTYARQSEGTGLGLGIARRLARLVGGEVGAESEPGEGSLFWLRVPLGAQAEDAPPPPAPTAAPARPLEVLLVEDNETNRFIARAMLQAAGHRVTEAVNGAIGVDLAAARRFDVVLMDISMPVMDGIEAACRIRSGNGASRASPIVAITAHALPEELARFRAQGMDDCLTKPLDRRTLLATLARVTDGADAPAPTTAPPEDGLESLLAFAGPEKAAALMDRFTLEMDALCARLDVPGPVDSSDALRREVHRCAGSCATFGLHDLHAALAGIETALKQGQSPPQHMLADLPRLWAEGRARLDAARAA